MTKLLGNREEGMPFVMSAPAGTGKTTLVARLTKEFPCVVESISCTTREKRPDEIAGVHYDFLSRQEFEEQIEAGNFLEYAEVFGYYYGTSKKYVFEELKRGNHVFLVIDTQGALKVQQMLDAPFIFISPPSRDELRNRLMKRRTESPEKIEERLQWAERELETITHYDYHIVNDNLEVAYETLRSIVIAEEHKIRT